MMRLSPASVTLAALCAPLARAQLSTQNLVSPASTTSGALTGLKYTSVGATGTYNQVTNLVPGTFPSCTVTPFCVTQPKQISGAHLDKFLRSSPDLELLDICAFTAPFGDFSRPAFCRGGADADSCVVHCNL